MATGTLSPDAKQTFLDTNGNPLVAGKLFTYLAGTVTPAATYTDVGLTVANANPIILDAAGRAVIYLSPGASYKYILQDSTGAAVWTQDNISTVPASSANLDITGTAGETLTAGQVVYLSDGSGAKTAGQWFKADPANTYSSILPLIGMVPATITIGNSGTIRLGGSVPGLTSLTIGALYYVSAAGALTVTAPANKRLVGEADTTSSILIAPNPPLSILVPATLTAHGVLVGNGASAIVATAVGATGTVLSGATGADPSFVALGVQDRQVTLVTVANTVTETTVYTFAVPANTLSTNRTLKLSLMGDHLINNGGADSVTVRVKYGATTIFTGTVAAVNFGANRGILALDLELTAANATGAQRAKGNLQVGDSTQNNAAGASSSLAGLNSYWVYGGHNAVAEDSTAVKNLVVTYQMGTANALIDMRAHTVYTELK